MAQAQLEIIRDFIQLELDQRRESGMEDDYVTSAEDALAAVTQLIDEAAGAPQKYNRERIAVLLERAITAQSDLDSALGDIEEEFGNPTLLDNIAGDISHYDVAELIALQEKTEREDQTI